MAHELRFKENQDLFKIPSESSPSEESPPGGDPPGPPTGEVPRTPLIITGRPVSAEPGVPVSKDQTDHYPDQGNVTTTGVAGQVNLLDLQAGIEAESPPMPVSGKQSRKKGDTDPRLRPLLTAMRDAYQKKYGIPLDIAWGRDMKQAKAKIKLVDELAGELGADPVGIILEAYELFLSTNEPWYEQRRHDIRLFWRDFQRFLGEVADRYRGIQRVYRPQYADIRPGRTMFAPGWAVRRSDDGDRNSG